jgi:hypothetical protein
MASKMNDLTVDQIKALCTTAAQQNVFKFAMPAALGYQEEQQEPGFLDEGEEPTTLADDMIYRLVDFLPDMGPYFDEELVAWRADCRAGRQLAHKIRKALAKLDPPNETIAAAKTD